MSETIEAVLRRLLEEHDAAGRLVTSRTIMVNRKHYAKVLGYQRAYLGKVGQAVFLEFDARLEDRLLSKVRFFLQQHASAKTIIFYRGAVNRTWIWREFGLAERLLFTKRFDELLEQYNSEPNIHDSSERFLLLQLQETIVKASFPRNPDGLSVSFRSLAKQLGTYPFKLKDEPYKSVIDETNRRLKNGEFLLPGEVISGGKLRSFRILIPRWPECIAERIANSFDTSFGSLQGGARYAYQLIIGVFTWIADSRNTSIRKCFETLKEGKLPDQASWGHLWNTLLEGVRRRHAKKGLQPSTLDQELLTLTRVFQEFARLRIFPDLPYLPKRPAKKVVQAKTRHRRTVAEAQPINLTPAHEVSNQAQRLVSNILAMHLDKGEFENQETAAFLKVLMEEVSDENGISPKDIPEIVKTILTRRLKLISEAARAIIVDAQAHLQVGKLLLSEATFTATGLAEILNCSSVRQRRELLNQWFPQSPKDHEIRSTTANILSAAILRYGGIVPSASSGNSLSIPGFPTSRVAVMARKVGGRTNISKYLIPNGEAVCAVLTDYMISAAANPAVAMSLPAQCMSPSDKPGFVQVTGKKLRAGGKPIQNDFHERSDVLTNIKWLVEVFTKYRDADTTGLANQLAVMHIGTELRAINEQYLLSAFRKLLASTPKLRGFKIVPSMIRRSVIVLQTLGSVDGSISAALANQSKPVNSIYNDIFAIRAQKDIRMREYIQDFESLVIIRATDVTELIGYSNKEIKNCFSKLQRTGLGTLCKNPNGKPGSEGIKCTEPRCAGDLCPQMDVRLHPEDVALLQIWKTVLLKAEPIWERDRAERWNDVWLPFLCLIQVIEEKSSRGALLAAWDAGSERRREIERDPKFKVPTPW